MGDKDEAWQQKIRVQQSPLLLHFVETDYRKSLTGARRDLVKMPFFPFLHGQIKTRK